MFFREDDRNVVFFRHRANSLRTRHTRHHLRQAALIHLERLWDENRFTAEGDVLHAVADKGGSRKNRGVRRVLSLPIGSVRLNLSGIADLVEFQPLPGGGERAFPVEYKRGKGP